MGKQNIRIKCMNEQIHKIQSREYNTLVLIWNHLIKIESLDDNPV